MSQEAPNSSSQQQKEKDVQEIIYNTKKIVQLEYELSEIRNEIANEWREEIGPLEKKKLGGEGIGEEIRKESNVEYLERPGGDRCIVS